MEQNGMMGYEPICEFVMDWGYILWESVFYLQIAESLRVTPKKCTHTRRNDFDKVKVTVICDFLMNTWYLL